VAISRKATRAVGEPGYYSDRLHRSFRASGGMADALASGASVLRDVGVQVPLRPHCDVSGHRNRSEPSFVVAAVRRGAGADGHSDQRGQSHTTDSVVHVEAFLIGGLRTPGLVREGVGPR
jgi:hypothetical protein